MVEKKNINQGKKHLEEDRLEGNAATKTYFGLSVKVTIDLRTPGLILSARTP